MVFDIAIGRLDASWSNHIILNFLFQSDCFGWIALKKIRDWLLGREKFEFGDFLVYVNEVSKGEEKNYAYPHHPLAGSLCRRLQKAEP